MLLEHEIEEQVAGGPAGPSGGTVLVVEDDLTVGQVVGWALQTTDWAVEVVRNLAGAREALEERDYDLILLDLNLPDGSGMELLRHLRRDLGRKTPVIVLSGMKQEDTVVHGLQEGADDYVTKPFSPRELIARVERWSRG